MNKFANSFYNTRGTTAIAYALIASIISIVIVGTLFIFGNNLNNLYALLPTIFG